MSSSASATDAAIASLLTPLDASATTHRRGGHRPAGVALYSALDDLILLREIMECKPFMGLHGQIMRAWDAAAARINECPEFQRKFPMDKGPGKCLQTRYYQLLDMRRQERLAMVSHRSKGAVHSEREALLDSFLALSRGAPKVHPLGQSLTVRDHNLILLEIVSRPPQLQYQQFTIELWNAIALKMQLIPEFSMPNVSGSEIERAIRLLLAMRRSQKIQKISLVDLDDEYHEREKLLDAFSQLLERQTSDAHKKSEVKPAEATKQQQQSDVSAAPVLQIADVTDAPEAVAVDNIELPTSASTVELQEPSNGLAVDATHRDEQDVAAAVKLPSPSDRPEKKQKRDDRETVEALRLQLSAETRLREHELRKSEQRFAAARRQQELKLRQAELELMRDERAAERDAQLRVAKAVAEGITTGIAAILEMLHQRGVVEARNAQSASGA